MPFDGSPLFAAFAPGKPFSAAVLLVFGILAVMAVVGLVLLAPIYE